MGIEFNLILKAAQKPVSSECFWRLFLGTVVMLAFGYAGETGVLEAWIGLHPLRDLQRRGRWHCRRLLSSSQGLLQLHARDRDRGLVHLPTWVLLRLPPRICGRGPAERGVQFG